MKAVIQRVKSSWVRVENEEIARIGYGLNVLIGFEKGDSEQIAKKMAKKITNLRIFSDENGKMALSLIDIKKEALVVSQFTLAAKTKGNRPDFSNALAPKEAKELHEFFLNELSSFVSIQSGQFGAMMEVGIINDGPVTIILEF